MSDRTDNVSPKAVPANVSLPSKLIRLSEVVVPPTEVRFNTGIPGLDQCLAEADDSEPGLPDGTSLLISGMPGGGKSTMATFMAAMNIAHGGQSSDSLYLHGEERAERIRKRWDRLNIKGINPYLLPLRAAEDAMVAIRDLQMICSRLVVVIDSVQSLTLGGKRRPEHQSEAAEMIMGLVTSAGGLAIGINHVDKSGTTHAGAQDLPHNVDIHLHITANARKAERYLEVRKNRVGRAGFQVPLSIGISSLTVGTPAPMSSTGGMVGARTQLEKAAEAAVQLLIEGKFLTGYDFEDGSERAGFNINPGMWRAGLEMAAKRLARDGYSLVQERAPNSTRRGWRVVEAPAPIAGPDLGPYRTVTVPAEPEGLTLDMDDRKVPFGIAGPGEET